MPVFADSGRQRGLAFIEFEEVEGASKALDFDKSEHMGRWLSIKRQNKDTPPPRMSEKAGLKLADTRTVFLGNLSWFASEDEVRTLFEDCGAIAAIRMAIDKKSGKHKGFAHIEFKAVKSVEKAVAKSGVIIGGRPVRVDYASTPSANEVREIYEKQGAELYCTKCHKVGHLASYCRSPEIGMRGGYGAPNRDYGNRGYKWDSVASRPRITDRSERKDEDLDLLNWERSEVVQMSNLHTTAQY
eukprot:g53453.t1